MTAIRTLFALPTFPVEARLHVHQQVRTLAEENSVPALSAHIDAALAHDRAAQQLLLQIASLPAHRYGPVIVDLDNRLDRSIGGFDTSLDMQIHVFGVTSERGRAATRIRRAALPYGPIALINLPYAQEHQAVNAMLTRLDNPDLADAIALVPEARPMIEHIRTLNQEYGALVGQFIRNLPSRDEARLADERGQEMLLQTIALIIAHGVATGNVQMQGELLQPVFGQHQELRQLRRRRRRAAAGSEPAAEPDSTEQDEGSELPDESPDETAAEEA